MQPTEPMKIEKDSKAALEAQVQAEKEARAQQCLAGIRENLKQFECAIIPTFQRFGDETQSGWVVSPK